MRGNRHHRNMVAVTVEQSVDEMQVSRPARARAHRQLAGQMRFRPGSKRGDFLMTRWHPFNGAHPVQAVGESVKRISRHTPDSLHSGLLEGFGNVVGYGLFHGFPSPKCDTGYKFR